MHRHVSRRVPPGLQLHRKTRLGRNSEKSVAVLEARATSVPPPVTVVIMGA